MCNHGRCPISVRECFACGRSDRTPVVFRRLEKVGELVLYGLRMSQRYKVSIPVELSKDPSAPWMSYNLIDNLLYIEVKQNKEDMEANEKTMPKTWEQCLVLLKDVEYIGSYGKVKETEISENFPTFSASVKDDWRYAMPLGLGNPMLALCQLLVCRNAWWKMLGYKPDWKNTEEYKWCIHTCLGRTVTSSDHSEYGRVLAFPDAGTAEEFHHTFKDLIEEAKELL